MKYIKYPTIIMLVLAVWIILNSIDDQSYDDLGIHERLNKVEDTDNGYQFVHYLNDPDYKMFESDETPARIRRHIRDEEWEQPFVNHILKKKSFILKDIEASTQKPFFKFPDYGGENALPWFSNFRSASFLLLLESKNYSKAREYRSAIDKLAIALKFGQQIKGEENSTLVSNAIGTALHMSQVIFTNQLLNSEDLSDELLNELQKSLNEINEYHDDGFKKVFWGEYKFTAFTIEEEKRKTIRQRLDDYRMYKEFWGNEGNDSLFEFFGFSRPGGSQLLRALIPGYYFHPNEFLTNIAPEYIKMNDQSNSYCKDIKVPEINWKPSWKDTISPNSMTKEMMGISFQSYAPYFERRCLTHVYFDAIRTVVALRRYKLVHRELPDNLDTLVPQYLKRLPVDYFDGSVLKYSREDGWLYSIGINLKDDGGSSDSFIESDNWSKNPTIPVSATIGFKHQ